MKILSVIVLSSAALALAGCGNQGGSSDQYNTKSGTTSNTNYNRRSVTNDYQSRGFNPGRINTGDGYSSNYPGWGTNDQSSATNSRAIEGGARPIDPERTNNVPEN